MRALDLFCGAGGASMGLHHAGFDVTGIDVKPQRRYPFRFVQADATRPPFDLAEFDFIWASPPCQRFVHLTRVNGWQDDHPDLIQPIRDLLAGHPLTCIENVATAPIRNDLILDGSMFGMNTWRKRTFELSFFVLGPARGKRFGPVTRPGSVSVCGHTGGAYRSRYGGWAKNGSIAAWRAAMGIDWMVAEEMADAIPPVYAEFIARAALAWRARASIAAE
jgi:DNA (cytosine-5)-methyltransferase 1